MRILVACMFVLMPSTAPAQTLIVLNKAEASASLIDLETLQEVARLETGQGPHEVAVSPSGRLAVACNYGVQGAPGNSLTVLDVPGAAVVGTIDLGEYTRPHGIQWFRDGKRVAVTVEGAQAVIVVDVSKGEVVQSIETGQAVSHMLVLSPDEKRCFVANIGSGTLTVLDLEKGEHVTDIETGEGAEGIDITPDGRHVWVTNRGNDTVSVIDARTLEIVETVASASFPIRAKATPDGRYMLVTNARSGELAVFDTETCREYKRITLDLKASDTSGRLFGDSFDESPVPIGILVDPKGHRAFIANANVDVVSIVDLENWKVSGGVVGGREPDGLGYSMLPVKMEARRTTGN